MPLTLKAINTELAKRGIIARLENAGYFYFCDGEAADWLDRTIPVPKVSSLNLEQWMEEFGKLKKRNAEILSAGKRKPGRSKK
jgi:hypothetical protein